MIKKLLLITTIFSTIVFFFGSTNLMAQKKRQQRKRPSSTKKVSPPTNDQQAVQQAIEFWNSRITKCGSDSYTQGYEDPLNYRRKIVFQFKNLNFNVSSNSVSSADRLNGIQYRGESSLNVEASRTFSTESLVFQNAGWSRWTDGLPIYRITSLLPNQDFGILMIKQDGQWIINSVSSSQSLLLQPITKCSSIER